MRGCRSSSILINGPRKEQEWHEWLERLVGFARTTSDLLVQALVWFHGMSGQIPENMMECECECDGP